jgi:hypothetical protein
VQRYLNIMLSLLVAAAMTVTSLPEVVAAPAPSSGVSTLCDGARCVSVLVAYGAKTDKASHKRPNKRPAYKPGKPNRPGADRPGKPNRPGYKPNRPGADRPGKPNRPGYKPNRPGADRPGKPDRPTTLPSFRPGDNRPGKPNKPGYRPNKPGKPNYGHHNRPPKWHHRPVHYRPYYRPWRDRDWYGAAIAGVILGTIITVAANTPPTAPSSELCWYWSNNARTQGYWDYCY